MFPPQAAVSSSAFTQPPANLWWWKFPILPLFPFGAWEIILLTHLSSAPQPRAPFSEVTCFLSLVCKADLQESRLTPVASLETIPLFLDLCRSSECALGNSGLTLHRSPGRPIYLDPPLEGSGISVSPWAWKTVAPEGCRASGPHEKSSMRVFCEGGTDMEDKMVEYHSLSQDVSLSTM